MKLFQIIILLLMLIQALILLAINLRFRKEKNKVDYIIYNKDRMKIFHSNKKAKNYCQNAYKKDGTDCLVTTIINNGSIEHQNASVIWKLK